MTIRHAREPISSPTAIAVTTATRNSPGTFHEHTAAVRNCVNLAMPPRPALRIARDPTVPMRVDVLDTRYQRINVPDIEGHRLRDCAALAAQRNSFVQALLVSADKIRVLPGSIASASAAPRPLEAPVIEISGISPVSIQASERNQRKEQNCDCDWAPASSPRTWQQLVRMTGEPDARNPTDCREEVNGGRRRRVGRGHCPCPYAGGADLHHVPYQLGTIPIGYRRCCWSKIPFRIPSTSAFPACPRGFLACLPTW